MTPLQGQPYQQASNPQAFFQEITFLREGLQDIQDKITSIESLHSEYLSKVDEDGAQATVVRLDAAVAEISRLNQDLAARIKVLKVKSIHDPDKAPQVGNLDRQFKDALRR